MWDYKQFKVEGIAPLEIHIAGEQESGINPTWRGQVTADARFATVLLIRAGQNIWWAKAEVAQSRWADISLVMHPLNYDLTSVQFLFGLEHGHLGDACAFIRPDQFGAPFPSEFHFRSGEWKTFCTIDSDPRTSFDLFFLSHTDVYAGRTGVWRPHKRLRGFIPQQCEAILFGPRRGMFTIRNAL